MQVSSVGSHLNVNSGQNTRSNPILDAASKALGLSTQDLMSQLRSGKSLGDIAQAQGKSMDDVKGAIKSALDTMQQNGQISQSQENNALSVLNDSSFGSAQSLRQLVRATHTGHHHHADNDAAPIQGQQPSSGPAATYTPSLAAQNIASLSAEG